MRIPQGFHPCAAAGWLSVSARPQREGVAECASRDRGVRGNPHPPCHRFGTRLGNASRASILAHYSVTAAAGGAINTLGQPRPPPALRPRGRRHQGVAPSVVRTALVEHEPPCRVPTSIAFARQCRPCARRIPAYAFGPVEGVVAERRAPTGHAREPGMHHGDLPRSPNPVHKCGRFCA